MNGNEIIEILNDRIQIDSKYVSANTVMHIGEKTLMKKLADITTKNGGHILEIGFGMHLSADAIQSNPNVISHTIIEIHPVQYQLALEWSKHQNVKTNIILGDWIDILPIEGKKFDGILHDTHLDTNISRFLSYIKNNCKNGSIVSFFEYPIFDNRMNGVRVKLPKDEVDLLPYKNNVYFSNYEYELKYTTFNGSDFYSEKKIHKKLL